MGTREYLLDKAFREGFMEGYQKGFKFGFDEGFEIGLNLGKQATKRALVLALKNSGASVSDIAALTGLSVVELKYLN